MMGLRSTHTELWSVAWSSPPRAATSVQPAKSARTPRTAHVALALLMLGLLWSPISVSGQDFCFTTRGHMVGGAPDYLDQQASAAAAHYRLDNGLAGAGADNLTGQGNVAVFVLSKDGVPVKVIAGRSKKANSLSHQLGLHEDVRLDSVSSWERPGFTFHSEGNITEELFAHFNELGDKTFWDSYDRLSLYSEREPCPQSCAGGMRDVKSKLRSWFRENAALWNRNNHFQFSATYSYEINSGEWIGLRRWSWYMPGDFEALP